MHKIIANKVYDTDTAKALGNWQRGFSSEKGYISETLYMKKTGEYFLHGEGGPRSRYAQRVAPNTWGYGERIIPISEEEAHSWAENHLTSASYDLVFGTVVDDESLSSVTLKLKSSTTEKLHRIARKRGLLLSQMAEELISSALDSKDDE